MTMARFHAALAAPLLLVALTLPAYADSMCKDGTTSATTGRGACSGHGGVQKGAKAAVAAAPAAPAAEAPAAAAKPAAPMADATGATAKCKDGSYSKSKSHSGACSRHGGVAEFIPAK